MTLGNFTPNMRRKKDKREKCEDLFKGRRKKIPKHHTKP